MTLTRHHLLRLALLVGLASATGCQSPRYDAWTADIGYEYALMPADADDVRDLPAFSGNTGAALGWSQIFDAFAWADVIIIGEQHDDAVGHAVQLAMVEDLLDRWPRSAVSMEMLTREHQIFVDDYLAGIIDARTFVRLAGVADWGGPGMWNEWYQPIVDAAEERGARVVAANAPRRYVRLARLEGYERLRALPRNRRALFDFPGNHAESDYRARFFDVMTAMAQDHAPQADDYEVDGEGGNASAHRHHHMSEQQLESIFRSQLLWDATMARSILRALPLVGAQQRKVIHLCGRFHSDFEGGTVLELRRHRPGLRILTISMAPVEVNTLRDEDRNRADVVIYTGNVNEEEEPDGDAPVDDPSESADS